MRRQLRGAIDRSSALTILVALLHLDALQLKTVDFLASCLAEDQSEWGRQDLLSLNALLGTMKVQVRGPWSTAHLSTRPRTRHSPHNTASPPSCPLRATPHPFRSLPQGITHSLGVADDVVERARAFGSTQAIRIPAVVEAVQQVLSLELGLKSRSIRSRQGWGVPIFVADTYAVVVVPPRQFLLNAPRQYNGQVTLNLRCGLGGQGRLPTAPGTEGLHARGCPLLALTTHLLQVAQSGGHHACDRRVQPRRQGAALDRPHGAATPQGAGRVPALVPAG